MLSILKLTRLAASSGCSGKSVPGFRHVRSRQDRSRLFRSVVFAAIAMLGVLILLANLNLALN